MLMCPSGPASRPDMRGACDGGSSTELTTTTAESQRPPGSAARSHQAVKPFSHSCPSHPPTPNPPSPRCAATPAAAAPTPTSPLTRPRPPCWRPGSGPSSSTWSRAAAASRLRCVSAGGPPGRVRCAGAWHVGLAGTAPLPCALQRRCMELRGCLCLCVPITASTRSSIFKVCGLAEACHCCLAPAEKMGLLKIETKEAVATRIAVSEGHAQPCAQGSMAPKSVHAGAACGCLEGAGRQDGDVACPGLCVCRRRAAAT